MGIMINRRRILRPHYDYVRIEYLESSDHIYIDTGITPTQDTGIRIKVTPISKLDGYIVGLREDNSNTRWCIGQSGRFYYGYGDYKHVDTSLLSVAIIDLNFTNDKYFRLKDARTLEVTGSINLPSLSFTPTSTIRLFGAGGYASSQVYGWWTGRMYYAKITQGTSLIMDLIPVRVGNVGYMYDKVSGQLFGNAGTGDFILGRDI